MTQVEDQRVRIIEPDSLFIGGAWVTARSSQTVSTVNPFTEQVVAELPDPSIADADFAVSQARKAFDSGHWAGLAIEERIRAIRRLCDEIELRFDEIGFAWATEIGATVSHRENMNRLAKRCWDSILEMGPTISMSEVRESAYDHRVEVRREPIGVALTILTWNGPLTQLAKKVVAALLAGCSVIAKLAPETGLVARLLAEAAASADLPPGVLSILAAGTETSAHLVAHPDVDVISFTGGTEIGAKVLSACAAKIGRCQLELGGKSAAIVLDDADLEKSIPAILGGMMPLQGQICTTRSRLLVSEARHDEVVEAVVGGLKSRVIGNPLDSGTTWGPMATRRSLDRIDYLVGSGLAQGATVVTGGTRPDQMKTGWFYEPTLFDDVESEMEIAQEEVFGPVYCVIRYRDVEDAIRIANDTRYGLSGSVYTSTPDVGLEIAHRVRSGTFAINSSGVTLTQPFGGMKSSGMGREGGIEGFHEYTELKTITL